MEKENMSRTQLLEKAKEYNIPYRWKMKKDELQEAISSYREGSNPRESISLSRSQRAERQPRNGYGQFMSSSRVDSNYERKSGSKSGSGGRKNGGGSRRRGSGSRRNESGNRRQGGEGTSRYSRIYPNDSEEDYSTDESYGRQMRYLSPYRYSHVTSNSDGADYYEYEKIVKSKKQ